MRVMRFALVALALMIAFPASLGAGGAAHHGRRIPVYDYSSAAWGTVVPDTVAALNAAMPRRVPRLVYRDLPERPCEGLPPRKHERGIVVCSTQRPEATGFTSYVQRRHVIERARVWLGDDSLDSPRRDPLRTACHELMHAVTGIPDRTPLTNPESCVQGFLTEPGAFDIAYAQRVYARHDREERREERRERRTERKHR